MSDKIDLKILKRITEDAQLRQDLGELEGIEPEALLAMNKDNDEWLTLDEYLAGQKKENFDYSSIHRSDFARFANVTERLAEEIKLRDISSPLSTSALSSKDICKWYQENISRLADEQRPWIFSCRGAVLSDEFIKTWESGLVGRLYVIKHIHMLPDLDKRRILIEKALDDEDWLVRRIAAQAIEFSYIESRVALIEKAFGSEDNEVQRLAAKQIKFASELSRAALIDKVLADEVKSSSFGADAVDQIEFASEISRAALIEKALGIKNLAVREAAETQIKFAPLSEQARLNEIANDYYQSGGPGCSVPF